MSHPSIHGYDPGADGLTLVERAMAAPVDSQPLSELARGKEKVVIIASDHTRPVPSKVIMPGMLQQIRQGNPIHEDMLWAARQAKLAYIVNVVVNEEKKVIFATAGAPEALLGRGSPVGQPGLLDRADIDSCCSKPVPARV